MAALLQNQHRSAHGQAATNNSVPRGTVLAEHYLMKKTHRKLKLDREVVRTLVKAELAAVAGGIDSCTGRVSSCVNAIELPKI